MIVTRIERLKGSLRARPGSVRVFDFGIEASVKGKIDPQSGMVVNLTALKEGIRERVVQRWNGLILDGEEGRPLARSEEELTRMVWNELSGAPWGAQLWRVRLDGRPEIVVECKGDETPMELTRIYDFSASHRLHSPELSEEENRNIFGKCNNPEGHGHNYILEVTLQGRPGASGEIAPAGLIDSTVRDHVVDAWDHKNLNRDLPEFRNVNPTAEGIVRIAWERLSRAFEGRLPAGVRLYRLKLLETARNHVEYFGED
jgi:6-pyruvoyltetrahydropterin/6-carboxytetrahydropterin synthase